MKALQGTIVLALLVCFSVPVAQGSSATPSTELFQNGRGFYLRGNYRNAAVYLQQALDLEKQRASRPGPSQGRLANAALAGEPQRTPSKVPQRTRICFILLADFPASQIKDLITYYRRKFQLEIEVLPSIAIPEAAIDNRRK